MVATPYENASCDISGCLMSHMRIPHMSHMSMPHVFWIPIKYCSTGSHHCTWGWAAPSDSAFDMCHITMSVLIWITSICDSFICDILFWFTSWATVPHPYVTWLVHVSDECVRLTFLLQPILFHQSGMLGENFQTQHVACPVQTLAIWYSLLHLDSRFFDFTSPSII